MPYGFLSVQSAGLVVEVQVPNDDSGEHHQSLSENLLGPLGYSLFACSAVPTSAS